MFRLDHLATRMRRNSENLLVLAGHEAPRKWTQPVTLVDVLRAALSEIEQYDRITLNVQSGLVIAGRAASDVVHLVAELVENATTFSRKGTQVYVTGQLLVSGGVLIEITDEGLGIPEQELAYANWRLDNPPVIDVAVSRRMGLFVVGRLAARHGIKVRLRRAQSGGLSALIWVPDTVAETEPTPHAWLAAPFRHRGQPGRYLPVPASAANGAGTPIDGGEVAARPKSIWFDTGEEEQTPAAAPALGSARPPSGSPARSRPPLSSWRTARRAESAANATETTSDLRLPIYDSIESEWFRRGSTSFKGAAQPAGTSWTSPADEGFRRAAETVGSPAVGRTDERRTAEAGAEREPCPRLDRHPAEGPAGRVRPRRLPTGPPVAGGGARPAEGLPDARPGRAHRRAATARNE